LILTQRLTLLGKEIKNNLSGARLHTRNKMKLQLEHIQGYLAHGLKVKNLNPHNDYSGGKEILTVNGTYYLYPKDEEPILFVSFKEHPTGKSFDSCIPILRKLDLTKSITVDGVEILPIVELAKKFHLPSEAACLGGYRDIIDAGSYGTQVSCYLDKDRHSYYSAFPVSFFIVFVHLSFTGPAAHVHDYFITYFPE